MPADIQAFDGESFEINAEQPPGGAALQDIWSVELSTGQVNVTLPTGLGFGAIGLQNTDLTVNIGSSVDRFGSLGRFAAFSKEDFLVVDLVIPMNEECEGEGTAIKGYDLVQLLNSAPAIKRYRGGHVEIWQNSGQPSGSVPTVPPIFGGFVSANLQNCKLQTPAANTLPIPPYLAGPGGVKPTIQWVNDAPVVDPPVQWSEANLFIAPPGITKIMRWMCDKNVVIMDESGRIFVYTPFYKVREVERCVGSGDLPHGTPGAPPGLDLPQRMVEVQIVAKLLFEQTRDGLITYYTYNAWGQLKGYREPYGREVAFVYGPLEGIDPLYSNLIVAAVDQFGRKTEFTYDANYTLSSIKLPTVATGAPSQPTLERTVGIGMMLRELPPRLHQRGTRIIDDSRQDLMEALDVQRPLDGTTASFAALFSVDESTTGGGRESARCGTAAETPRGWAHAKRAVPRPTATARITSSPCTQDSWVTVTGPDGAETIHYFDHWGNETERKARNQSGAFVSWTMTNEPLYNMLRSETDPATVTTSFGYQLDLDGGWWTGPGYPLRCQLSGQPERPHRDDRRQCRAARWRLRASTDTSD